MAETSYKAEGLVASALNAAQNAINGAKVDEKTLAQIGGYYDALKRAVDAFWSSDTGKNLEDALTSTANSILPIDAMKVAYKNAYAGMSEKERDSVGKIMKQVWLAAKVARAMR